LDVEHLLIVVAEGMVYYYDYRNHPKIPVLFTNRFCTIENVIQFHYIGGLSIVLNEKGTIYIDIMSNSQFTEKMKNVQQVAWNLYNVYFLKKKGTINWMSRYFRHEKKILQTERILSY